MFGVFAARPSGRSAADVGVADVGRVWVCAEAAAAASSRVPVALRAFRPITTAIATPARLKTAIIQAVADSPAVSASPAGTPSAVCEAVTEL